ncbi:hypothetical protein AMTRI_Chr11g100200 [Amborella trichopoda]
MPQLHFFECMHALRELDLSRIGIESLPRSLSNLVNLRILRLKSCHELEGLPPEIGELQQLQLLDVQGCIQRKELVKEDPSSPRECRPITVKRR